MTEDDYNAVAAIANLVGHQGTSQRNEAETRHDIMALTKAMAEAAAKQVGASISSTSSDIVDTAVGLNCETASFCFETTLSPDRCMRRRG